MTVLTWSFLEPPPDIVPLLEGVFGKGGFCDAAIWLAYFFADPFDQVFILKMK